LFHGCRGLGVGNRNFRVSLGHRRVKKKDLRVTFKVMTGDLIISCSQMRKLAGSHFPIVHGERGVKGREQERPKQSIMTKENSIKGSVPSLSPAQFQRVCIL
jgi:hypothetical protein